MEKDKMETRTEKTTRFPRMGKKGVLFLIAAAAAAGLLLLFFGGRNVGQTARSDEERLKEYEASLEEKIASLCADVRGAGNVRVAVYFDSGFETLYACDEESKSTSSGVNSEKKYVTVGSGSGESMVSVMERMPHIGGIAIVCRGGGDAVVCREILSLVSSAFGVPKTKIYVTEGK